MTIDELVRKARGTKSSLHVWAREALENAGGEIKTRVQDQLWDGIRADGQLLRPLYTEDPYFRGNERQMRWYIQWKNRITANANRPEEAPNLFINGKFYSELTVECGDDSMEVRGRTSFSNGIIEKYGKSSFGLTDGNLSKVIEASVCPHILKRLKELWNS